MHQICARIFQVIEQTSLIHPILPHQGVFPWNQNREKFVVHSAANEKRKVLDSRKNGQLNIKLGLRKIDACDIFLADVTPVATYQKSSGNGARHQAEGGERRLCPALAVTRV